MKRREFIAGFGVASAWPLALRAQPRLTTIGALVPANPEPFWTKVRDSLRELGYVEGKNVRFEFRTADGKPGLLNGLAEELVRLNVDLIVVWQTPAAFAARKATTSLPIVMASVADPVGTGLVASLARPGGNITGLSGTTAELGAKILELIREMIPPSAQACWSTLPIRSAGYSSSKSSGAAYRSELRSSLSSSMVWTDLTPQYLPWPTGGQMP